MLLLFVFNINTVEGNNFSYIWQLFALQSLNGLYIQRFLSFLAVAVWLYTVAEIIAEIWWKEQELNSVECVGESFDPLSHCLIPKSPIKMINGETILPEVIYKRRQQSEVTGRQKIILIIKSRARSNKTAVEFHVLQWYRAWQSGSPLILFNITGH